MQHLVITGLAVLLTTAAPATAAAQSSARPSAPAQAAALPPSSDAWHLRPGDAVRIQVGDQPHLNGQFPVSEDGVALLPLIGPVAVAGRPFPAVRSEILDAYGVQLVDAAILVTPVLRIVVLGEVRQPGLVTVDPTFTVADVLAAAGGVTPLGNPSKITLAGDQGSVRFSLTDDEDDVLARPLRPGDQLVVPRRGWARENLNVLLGAGASVLAAAVTSLLLR